LGFFHRHRGSTPYLLLAPGLLFLAVFFLVPLGFLAYQSLQSGTIDFGYSFTWQWSNFSDAVSNYKPQFIRSFVYAGIATLIALVVSYPVAYWIAFRGGRWKNLLLLGIVAPFFVTYLIRTLAWETILADHGLVVNTLRHLHLLGILGQVDLSGGLRVLDGLEQLADPALDELEDPVADPAGTGVDLRRHGREEASAREDAALEVGEELVRERPQPRATGRCRHTGLDHLGGEERGGRVDRGELELLLGLEVRVEAALAHADVVGQPADREAVQALDRGQPGCGVEDRVPRALAV